MSEFTPGPWSPHRYSVDYISIFGGEAGCIARVSSSINTNDPEKEDANAHLIAAAPEMYEALEAALPKLSGVINDNKLRPEDLGYECDGYQVLQKVKIALAKARGEE